ncbi:putative E3 ubiquitin-protein ligase UBR7 isoform X3 [Portunus trituberculatus]|uniref:putative E3 ubiquitin-protein ligase UBR7 isoform X3 n=1 Tax=Portunus trituberculatus TaxID=210409 RepID=UPI001E1CF20B|nr:putative E3 ubiquitin-protein ligase UBR7 isoform X3 [Portunus trituberculatus]
MAENAETEESGISMVEVLQEEEERQLNAAAVLGAADDTRCTYDQGYMKRQALYACMTCCPADGEQQAGVCLACSYHCHEDHDLVELYTKRNFRCDCGNSKFPHNPCKLLKEKLAENSENRYNHNFRGVYCTCNRPYPDPEDPNEDEMIQCCLCEDWYHGKHQGGSAPAAEMFSDMICTQCLPKHEFLAYFVGLAVTAIVEEEAKTKIDNENSPSKNTQEESRITFGTDESSSKTTQDEVKNEEKKVWHQSENIKEMESKEDSKETGAEKSQKSDCKLISMTKHTLPKGALFFPNSWRQQLCVCENCKATYKDEGIVFLLDDEDTVNFYEESGKSHQPSSSAPVQRELEALSSLDRVVRTEMVHEYNNLSSSLREYLRKFAESKKVVRDEDIREFFSQLAANKKQKPNSGVQLFCR